MQESSRNPLNTLPEEVSLETLDISELWKQFYKLIELLKQKKRVCNKDIGLMSEVCEQFYWLTEEKGLLKRKKRNIFGCFCQKRQRVKLKTTYRLR